MAGIPPGGGTESTTLPAIVADPGKTIVWFGPALTANPCDPGGARTVIFAEPVLVYCPSLALNWTRYIPGALKVACVTGLFGLLKRTFPGPANLLQDMASVLPGGKPSSVAVPFRVVVLFGKEMV